MDGASLVARAPMSGTRAAAIVAAATLGFAGTMAVAWSTQGLLVRSNLDVEIAVAVGGLALAAVGLLVIYPLAGIGSSASPSGFCPGSPEVRISRWLLRGFRGTYAWNEVQRVDLVVDEKTGEAHHLTVRVSDNSVFRFSFRVASEAVIASTMLRIWTSAARDIHLDERDWESVIPRDHDLQGEVAPIDPNLLAKIAKSHYERMHQPPQKPDS